MRRLRPLPSLAPGCDEHSCDITIAVDGQDPTTMTTTRYVDVERPALDHSDVRILVAVPHGTEGTGSQRTMALRFGDGQTADR